mmetsp:Transcript_23452/g.55524  ORF Transcript_23452/g.55524 Transcript_23452/m.55524 type:complete len:313 (-) Transcript_23452:828-1766(-)
MIIIYTDYHAHNSRFSVAKLLIASRQKIENLLPRILKRSTKLSRSIRQKCILQGIGTKSIAFSHPLLVVDIPSAETAHQEDTEEPSEDPVALVVLLALVMVVFFFVGVWIFLLFAIPRHTLHGRSFGAGHRITAHHAGITDMRFLAVRKGLAQGNKNIPLGQSRPRYDRTLFMVDHHGRALINTLILLHSERVLQQSIFHLFFGISAVRHARLDFIRVDVRFCVGVFHALFVCEVISMPAISGKMVNVIPVKLWTIVVFVDAQSSQSFFDDVPAISVMVSRVAIASPVGAQPVAGFPWYIAFSKAADGLSVQ